MLPVKSNVSFEPSSSAETDLIGLSCLFSWCYAGSRPTWLWYVSAPLWALLSRSVWKCSPLVQPHTSSELDFVSLRCPQHISQTSSRSLYSDEWSGQWRGPTPVLLLCLRRFQLTCCCSDLSSDLLRANSSIRRLNSSRLRVSCSSTWSNSAFFFRSRVFCRVFTPASRTLLEDLEVFSDE